MTNFCSFQTRVTVIMLNTETSRLHRLKLRSSRESGDSGGPLVKALLADPDQGPRYFLFGLVSFGIPSCGKFPTPAVYRNVSHYLPWVFANIKD